MCAILSRQEENEEQFLICRQSGANVLDGLYEFPGGKVNHGECLVSALKREIREVLGAEVEVKGYFMHPFTFNYTKEKDGIEAYIKLYPMLCTLRADSPDPSARDGVHDDFVGSVRYASS